MNNQNLLDIDELIEKYADMVYRIALTQMKNIHDAQDVFQEVFLRLVKHLSSLENEEHVKAWLIRVTINCSKTNLTNAFRRYTQPYEESSDLIFEDKEQEQLYKDVQNLPKKYAVVVYLHYYEELSIKEIGEITGQKESTVKSQLSRARALLRSRLVNQGMLY